MNEPPFSSPESRAALREVIDFVRAHVADDVVTGMAFSLAFESDEAKSKAMREGAAELQKSLAASGIMESMRPALTLALLEIVKERVVEMESQRGLG